MDILVALKQEEAKLQQQLKRVQGAIAVLNNGAHHAPVAYSPSAAKESTIVSERCLRRESEDFKVNKSAVGKVHG